MSILIFGNCQIGSLADSIEILVEGSKCDRVLASNEPAILKSELHDAASAGHELVLIHDSVQNIIDINPELQGILPASAVLIPTITFSAFQPDIQYAFAEGRVMKNGLKSDWNSRILLWAYVNGLSHIEARQIFCEEVYEALGYFDEWNVSEQILESAFERCGFDYRRWMRAVQRSGAFMYGINHPVLLGLTNLGAQIAERHFGATSSRVEEINSQITDHLAHIVWPVYPEIGDRLGLDGSMNWQVGAETANLDTFIAKCFSGWDSVDLKNLTIQLIPELTEQEASVLLDFSKGE